MDTARKLEILADDAQYDLSCACGTGDDDRRKRSAGGAWVYPASLPRGGKGIMLKTLQSNACENDCRYCPLRAGLDTPRVSLTPDEIARSFMELCSARRYIHGMFLTSGVAGSAERSMERMVATAELLRRRHGYRGFLHLKILPGASDGAIESALAQASAVSLNVESPRAADFAALATRKDFDHDIVRPMRLISRLTGRGMPYARVKTTTQFLVGAADERDRDIVAASEGLYRRLGLQRIYFSAYQRGLGDPSLPGERAGRSPHEVLTREHRLYQVDFLLRRYRWSAGDIGFDEAGQLPLDVDPKRAWADRHPEAFPIRLRSADRAELLRVPGLGPVSVGRILDARRDGGRPSLREAGLRGKRLSLASRYVTRD